MIEAVVVLSIIVFSLASWRIIRILQSPMTNQTTSESKPVKEEPVLPTTTTTTPTTPPKPVKETSVNEEFKNKTTDLLENLSTNENSSITTTRNENVSAKPSSIGTTQSLDEYQKNEQMKLQKYQLLLASIREINQELLGLKKEIDEKKRQDRSINI